MADVQRSHVSLIAGSVLPSACNLQPDQYHCRPRGSLG